MRTALLSILLLIASGGVFAQSCTGGLGDPLVDITFGSGSGPGGPLASGVTNLIWQSGGCPSDGGYAIVNYTSNCWSNTWVSTGDHTGNQNGYFMLINASYDPSDFYVQRVDGLCGGTNFQFAAWILNMANVTNIIKPNITFNIEQTDGTVLASFKTGDIPATIPEPWVQYAFYFTTPPGVTSVVIRLTNNAPGGDGNDLALDDITFRAAGPAISTSIPGYPSDTINLCQSDNSTLSFQSNVENCYSSPSYQWQQSIDGGTTWTGIAGANSLNFLRTPTTPGSYEYRLSVTQTGNIGIPGCAVASPAMAVNVIPTPQPALSIQASAASVCAGYPVTFSVDSTNGGSSPNFVWQVNGAAAGSDSTGFTTNALNSGDIVTCTMTSDAACVINSSVQSNPLSVNVIANPVTSVSVAASATDICSDSVVNFTATAVNGGSAPSYQWQVNGVAAGSNAPVFSDSLLQNGDVVNCVMTGSLTCSVPVSSNPPVTMTVHPLPSIQLLSDTTIAGGKSVQLSPLISGDIATYTWTPGDWLDNASIADPVATPPSSISYQLQVTTKDGCSTLATETVGVFYGMHMPDAFTPNGDGHNDLFRVPSTIAVSYSRLSVFNRWGQLVFTSRNNEDGWDGTLKGKPQPAGAYVWALEYIDPITKHNEKTRGTVLLIR